MKCAASDFRFRCQALDVGKLKLPKFLKPGTGMAAYRRGFGQPRQEDLLAYLVDRVSPERLEELRPLLQIDLRPGEVE